MKRAIIIGMGIVVGLLGPGGVAMGELSPEATTKVTPEYYDASQWLRMAEVAHRFEDYDLAVGIYQKIIARFPSTRWARQAEAGITQIKADAKQHLAFYDPALAGTQAGVKAQAFLRAGNLAYSMNDPVIALRFYERARDAAPNSRYSRTAEEKIRWVRRWKNPGP